MREHIGKDKFLEKVVFRHIKFERGDEMVNKLEIFLNEVIGNKYSITPQILTQRETLGISDEDENILVSSERTFFCSELVAKAFKVLGVTQNDKKSCGKYYPGHFSIKNDSVLKLNFGTEIQDE